MNSGLLLFEISITIFIITINNSILAELNESTDLPEEVLNENETDIHKNYSNVYCSTDIILDDSTELSSEHYVSEEDPGYIWRIIVPEDDHQILLQFQYVINRAFNNSHENCKENYIEIRNGLSSGAPLIQRVCADLPLRIYSIGRELYIKLVNNETSLQFATYISNVLDRCHDSVHNCEHNCVNTFQGHKCLCDEGFNLDSDGEHCSSKYKEYGTIDHEKCENTYDTENYECRWKIFAPKNYRIVLNFTHLNLDEEHNDFYNCSRNNHVKILDKLNNDKFEVEGPYCGTELPEIRLSRSDKMGIEFRTNKNALNSEFVANYHIVKDECAFNNGDCPHECRKTITSFECFSCTDPDSVDDYE